jgi:Xaa-Pro aminopeptidase
VINEKMQDVNKRTGKRLEDLRKKLEKKGMDGALICKRENYTYFSGFTGSLAYIIVTSKRAYLLTDSRYVSQAAKQAPCCEIIRIQGEALPFISDVVKEHGIEKIGFEEKFITYDFYTKLKSKLDKIKLMPLFETLDEMRAIKDDDEIKRIKNAVEIADSAFRHILTYIRPGIKEYEIAAEIEYFMKKNGAQGPAFDTIVASGWRSSLPHGVASDKKIEKSDMVILDYGAVCEGYCSDITRTIFVGSADSKKLEIYNTVLNAQTKALESIREGFYSKKIDGIARDHIAASGYGENFGHGLGHGVGLEIHEQPRISPYSNGKLARNMVFTIEPGIYLEGFGGVRIEDIVVVKEDGAEILTKAAKEPIII